MCDNDWSAWTSCEMYGHNFVEVRCTDCDESVADDDDNDVARV